nr:zinc finger, CCHC-type [Tanacetum cinerariifolium]
MLITIEPDIQRNLETLHAHEMLLELKTLFAQQPEQELLQTTQDSHSCKQEEGQSVSSYVLKMKVYIDNLERLGNPMTLGLGIPPPPKREDPTKDPIYHECGEIGHWKRNCPQYLAELLKKKKNVASRAGGL